MSDGKARERVEACFCVGPQNGDPVCPCRMRHLKPVNGRWIEEIDHGPIKDDSDNPENALDYWAYAWKYAEKETNK